MRFILAFSYNLITLPKNQRTVRLRQRGFKFGSGLIASGFLLLVLSSTPIKQSQCTPSNPTPTSTPSPTPTSTPTPTITTSEAVDLIEKYLAAKNNMLGKNYITSDAEKYTTDKLYEELLSSSYPTSITWLKKIMLIINLNTRQ